MLWSFLILAVALVGIVSLRSFSKRVRIAFDVVCLVGLSAVLYKTGITPLFHEPFASSDASTTWMRAIAVAWWLLGARVTVSVMYFALNHDRNSRQTRLFFDLIAGAIYLCTGLIVIKSVLALPIGGVLATSGIVAIVLGPSPCRTRWRMYLPGSRSGSKPRFRWVTGSLSARTSRGRSLR